jgi:hypothetical protein
LSSAPREYREKEYRERESIERERESIEREREYREREREYLDWPLAHLMAIEATLRTPPWGLAFLDSTRRRGCRPFGYWCLLCLLFFVLFFLIFTFGPRLTRIPAGGAHIHVAGYTGKKIIRMSPGLLTRASRTLMMSKKAKMAINLLEIVCASILGINGLLPAVRKTLRLPFGNGERLPEVFGGQSVHRGITMTRERKKRQARLIRRSGA